VPTDLSKAVTWFKLAAKGNAEYYNGPTSLGRCTTTTCRCRWRRRPGPTASTTASAARSFIDNLLVRIHFIIVMSRWTGLAPWEFEFPSPGSLTSTFLCKVL